jgi:sedoheptulokinase
MNSIGLDIGTTSVCAIKADALSGEITDIKTRPNNSFINTDKPFEKIQDPEKILNICRELLDSIIDTDTVSIGISTQMHGILYVDKFGKSLSPFYIWQDMRGDKIFKDGKTYAGVLNTFPGYGSSTHLYNKVNGLIPHDAKKFTSIGDYVAMNLTGNNRPAVNITVAASFGCFDEEKNKFKNSEENFPDEYFPDVISDFSPVGKYKNIIVTPSIGDNQAGFLGAVGNSKDILLNVGTGSQVSLISDYPSSSPSLETRPYDGKRYLLAGCALCGGRAFSDVVKFIGECATVITGEKYDNIYPFVDKLMIGSNGTAENKPIKFDTRFCGTRRDSSVTGSITGITENNLTPYTFLVGALDGMAEELFDYYSSSGVSAKEAVATGNGVRKNKKLKEIFERKFNMPVKIPKVREEAAFGAFLSSLIGIGKITFDDTKKYISYE